MCSEAIPLLHEYIEDNIKYTKMNSESEQTNSWIHFFQKIFNSIKSLPKDLKNFFVTLKTTLGTKFLIILFAVYGVNQGLGEGWYYPAQNVSDFTLNPTH